MPIYVRAGAIIPFDPVRQYISEQVDGPTSLKIFPGANGEFTLYDDDGKTYSYESGKSEITHLHWADTTGKLEHSGASAWSASDDSILTIIGN